MSPPASPLGDRRLLTFLYLASVACFTFAAFESARGHQWSTLAEHLAMIFILTAIREIAHRLDGWCDEMIASATLKRETSLAVKEETLRQIKAGTLRIKGVKITPVDSDVH